MRVFYIYTFSSSQRIAAPVSACLMPTWCQAGLRTAGHLFFASQGFLSRATRPF